MDLLWNPTRFSRLENGSPALISSAPYLQNACMEEDLYLTDDDGKPRFAHSIEICDIHKTVVSCILKLKTDGGGIWRWDVSALEWNVVKKKADGIRARKRCELDVWKPETIRTWIRIRGGGSVKIPWHEMFSAMMETMTVEGGGKVEDLQLFVHILAKIVKDPGFLMYWILTQVQVYFRWEELESNPRRLDWIAAILDMICFRRFPLNATPTLDLKDAESMSIGNGRVWFDVLTLLFDPKSGSYYRNRDQ
jgi:hypothetical protein